MITLDDFFLGQDLELVNLAGSIGTDIDRFPDTAWAGDTYGSAIHSLIQIVGGEGMVRRELQRLLDISGLEGEIQSIELNTARLQIGNVTIVVQRSSIVR